MGAKIPDYRGDGANFVVAGAEHGNSQKADERLANVALIPGIIGGLLNGACQGADRSPGYVSASLIIGRLRVSGGGSPFAVLLATWRSHSG